MYSILVCLESRGFNMRRWYRNIFSSNGIVTESGGVVSEIIAIV